MFGSGRRRRRGGERMRGLGLGLTNPVGTGGVLEVCRCLGCGGVGGKWVGVWKSGGVGSLCELCVWIICVDGRSRYVYIVLGGYLRILGAPSFQSCCTLSISASDRVFFYIANPDLFVCSCRTWICLVINCF